MPSLRVVAFPSDDLCFRPFVLLTGTAVVLILLVAGSVALLSAIGSNELPSTLTGGVAHGSKRD